ncbi:BTAD domain-containing putative transcriptional regulator [Nocardioides sp. 503]|uniref:ATP-binding protein n=1 Tax=Nocardioides sp. 503 TaxID=2508326 RepID=UPI0010702330|nr:BTAD domain-containing putative transcriptional regulator [Nocardioides sp. 503]
MTDLRIGVLGPLQVTLDGRLVEVGPKRHREVLVSLVVDAGRAVPADLVLQRVWGERGASLASLHAIISRLRARLGAGAIATTPTGYRLDVPVDAVDAPRFEAAVAQARSTAEPSTARRLLVDALASWRGPAYADVHLEVSEAEALRLDDLRLGAQELLAELDLEVGRHADVATRLPTLVAEHPLRESLRASLMLALYRSGRQTEALASYDDARELLAEELGLDPGPALQRLHHRILNQDPDLSAVASVAPTSPPVSSLVGRGSELQRIAAAVRSSTEGAPRVSVVIGEAGIGKTRLVEEVVRTADVPAVWGRCWEHHGSPALWPWEQALSALAVEAGPEAVRGALTGRAEAAALLLTDVPGLDLAATEVPAAAPTRLYDAVTTFLEALTADHPAVLVLEDLQWADRESIELASYVAASLGAARLALVLTIRDPADGPGRPGADLVADLTRSRRLERVDLQGLTVEEVRALAGQWVDGPVDRRVAEALRDRTEGNPFYVSELARLLTDERGVSGRADVPVPAGVRAVIERRLRHLPELDREVLRTASVIGREFELGVLAEVVDRPRFDVVEVLDHAIQAGLLSAPSGREQRFSHALVRETLVLGVGPHRKAHLHARVARSLESRRGDDEVRAAAIAHHYASAGEAGSPETGIRWALQAASYAERRVALHEAERSIRQALELVPLVPAAAAGRCELEVRVRLGSLLTLRLGYNAPEVAEQRRLALDLAERVGSVDHLLSALWGTWGNALVSGDFAAADATCERLEAAVGRTQDPLLGLALHAARGQTRWHQGRLAEARDDLEAAVALADTLDDLPVDVFLQHPGIQARLWLAVVLALQGLVDESDALAEDTAEQVAELRHDYTTAYAGIVLALRDLWLHRPASAERHARGAAETARRHGFEQLEAFALIPSGGAHAQLGDVATAETQLRAALTAFGALPSGHMFGHLMLGLLADTHHRAGRGEEALAVVDRALEESALRGERFHLAELLRLRATVRQAVGEEPGEDLASARAVAAAQGLVLRD